MSDTFSDLNSLMATITPEENLLPEVPVQPISKLAQKGNDIEANRRLKHAAIAEANAIKKATFDAASLSKKLEMDRPQALNTITVDTNAVNATEFLDSDLPLTIAEKFNVYARNERDAAQEGLQRLAVEREGTRSRTLSEATTDATTALLAQGAVGLGEAGYGVLELASRMNPVSQITKAVTGEGLSLDRGLQALGLPGSKGFSETREIINQNLMSDPAKYQKAAVQADAASRQAGKAERLAAAAVNGKNTWWDLAKEEGGSFNAGLKALANNPIELTNSVLESGLMMFVPGAIATKAQGTLVKGMAPAEATAFLVSEAGKEAAEKLATKAGIGTNALLEGMTNAVSAKGEVLATDLNVLADKSPLFNELVKQGLSPEEARMQVSENVFDSVAVIAATIGGVTSKVTGTAKLEGELFKSVTGNAAKDTALGTIKEGTEETIQGIGGELAQNIGTKLYVDPDQALTEGLGLAAASGLASGALSGGAVSGVASATEVGRTKAKEVLAKRATKKAEETKITDAVNAGIETGDYSKVSELPEADKEAALAAITSTEVLSNPKLQMDRAALTKHLDAGREIILAKKAKVTEQAALAEAKINELNEAGVDKDSPEYEAANTALTKANEDLDLVTAQLKTFVGIRRASKIESGTLKEAIFKVSQDENQTDADTKTSLINIIRNMGSSLDSFDDADLSQVAALPNKQASELAQSALNLRSALGISESDTGPKSSAEVNVDITEGTKAFRGVGTYVQSFKEALATGNNTQALKILNNTRSLLKRNQDNLAAYKPLGKETDKQLAYKARLLEEQPVLKAAVDYFQKAHAATFNPVLGLEAVPTTVETPDVKVLNPVNKESASSVNNNKTQEELERIDDENRVKGRTVTKLKDGSLLAITTEAAPKAFSSLVRMEHGEPIAIIAKTDDGLEIGRLTYMPNGGPIDVFVKEDFRRKGVATALYDKLEELGGKIPDAKTGVAISSDAEAFRTKRSQKTKTVAPVVTKDVPVSSENVYDELTGTITGLTGLPKVNKKTAKTLESVQSFFSALSTKAKPEVVRARLDAYKQGMIDAYNNTVDESNTNRDYQNGVQFIFNNGVAYNTVADMKRKSIKRMEVDGKQKSRLAVYVNQSKTSASKNPNLQLVPDLMSKVRQELVSGEFTLLQNLEDNEVLALDSVDSFVKQFTKQFDQLVKIGKSINGVFTVFDAEIANNPALDFIEETVMKDGSVQYSFNENFKTAVAVSAFGWLTGEPEASDKFNTDDRINAALGRKAGTPVPEEAYDLLWDAGVYANNVESKLGEQVLRLLGVQVSPSAPLEYEIKMANAIGKWATNLLVGLGYSETLYVRTEEMLAINGQVPEKGVNTDPTIFIRPKLYDGEIKPELSEFIQQMQNAPETLDKVFGLVAKQPMPLLEMPTAVRLDVNNSTQQAPKELAELRLKHEQKPHVVKKGMAKLVNTLSNGFLLRAAGAIPSSELNQMHSTEQRTALTKNQELNRVLGDSMAFIKNYADKAFYFQHDIWANMRMGEVGKINMQANKIDRWLLTNTNWITTVDTDEQRAVYKQAIAAQFGVKIEEKTDKEIATWFADLVNDPVIRDAVKAIKTLKAGNFTDADKKNLENQLFKAVKQGKENFGTLAALEALSTYSATKPFETDLAIEIDGKTNGFIFSLIQYAGAASIDALKPLLNRGGVFFDKIQNLSEWVKTPSLTGQKNLDSYQAIGVSWGQYINTWDAYLLGKTNKLNSLAKVNPDKLAEAKQVLGTKNLEVKLSSIAKLVGSFTDENGDVTKVARDLSKDPLMTTNYGAGIEKIIGNFSEKIIADFYKKLAKAHTNKDAEMLAGLKESLENVIGEQVNLNLSNALKFTLTTKQSDVFKAQLTATYGVALEGALIDNFGPMLDNRKRINDAFSKVSDAYALVFKDRQKKQLELNNGQPITKQQFEDIKAEVDGLFPYLRSYFATSDKNSLALGTFDNVEESGDVTTDTGLADGVKFAKKHPVANNQVRVEFNAPISIANGKARKSASSYVELPEFNYDGVGVRGPALAIQSMDATVMVLTLADFQTHNNHDAHMVSVTDAIEATKALNANFFKVNKDYSLINEASAMLDKAIAASDSFKDIEGMDKAIAGMKKQSAALKKPVVVLPNGTLGTIEEGRKAILDSVTYINQYTMNGGAFDNTLEKPVVISTEDEMTKALNSLYSAPGAINGFTETTGAVVDTVAVAVGMLDQLQSVDTAPTTSEHMDQLRGLLAKFGSVLKPLYVAIDNTKDKTLGRYFEGKKRIEITLNRNAPTGILRGMSAAETFAHEMTHSFVKVAMDKQTRYTKKLKYLYDLAKINVKPSDLIERDAAGNVIANPTPEQIAAGQATWDYLFGNPTVRKERVFNKATNMYEYVNSNDMFQEFIAYMATNKQLQDAVKYNQTLNTAWAKGEPKERTETAAQSGVFKTIDSWLGQFLDYVNRLITGFEFQILGLKNVTADVAAMDLVYRAVNIQANHTSVIMNNLEKFADVNSQVIDAVSNWIIQPIAKWLAKAPKDGVIKDVATIISTLPETSAEGLNKAFDQLINRAKLSEDSLMLSLYREAQGATTKTAKFHILLRMSNTYIDRMRKNVATDVKRMVNSQFTRVLEKAEKNALTRALLKTDIAYIMESVDNPNGYTLDQLKGLLTNQPLLLKEITATQKLLTASEYGNNRFFYMKQADSLGSMMARGFHTEKAGGLNAHVVANMLTTAGYGKKQGDIKKAEAIIDKLATLHALAYTNAMDKSIVAKLIDSEANGVDFVIQTQRFMRKDAQNRLFTSKVQMVKGYIKEIVNPNIDVIVRPLSEAATLAQEGYVFEKTLPKDSMDPAPEQAQYIQRHRKMNSLLAGIVSYTSKGAKGTDLIEAYQSYMGEGNPAAFGRAVTDGAAIKSQLKSHMKDLFSPKITANKENNLVPVVAENGFTTGYRYMMTEETKLELLEKNDALDEVLGVTLANVQDKLNTKIINRKLVETAKEDFDTYGVSEGREFIAFGPGIGSKEDQELYNLMPEDMKRDIKAVWGTDTMYIRARNKHIIFGSRRKSAADFVPNFNNKVLNTAAQVVVRQLNRPGVQFLGNGWQELVKMAKDAIVIKSGTVLAFNVLSNTVLLKLAGVPALDILKHHKTAFSATAKYQKEQHELNILKMEVGINKKLTPAEVKAKKTRIAFLENELSTSPVHELIKAGIYQTIVEDLSDEDESFTYASELEEKLEKVTRHIPNVVKDAAKLVSINHDTKLYKALRNTTQMSDFVARYTLHQHNLSNGMSGPESIAQIMRTFIDYDPPTHPTIEYLNSMGLVMFTKYFIRIQRVLVELGIKNPGNILLLLLAQGATGVDIEDPYQSMALDADNIFNKIHNPIIDVPTAIVSHNIFNFGGL